MTTAIAAPLSADAYESKAGENYTAFNVRLGVKFWDHTTSSNLWTNYAAALFVKNDQQSKLELYRKVLVKGTVLDLAATHQKACVGKGKNDVYYPYIELLKPNLVNFWIRDKKEEEEQQQQ